MAAPGAGRVGVDIVGEGAFRLLALENSSTVPAANKSTAPMSTQGIDRLLLKFYS